MKRLSLIVGGCVLGAALLLTPWLGPGLVQPASTGSARASTDSAESSTGPKLIALKFHADWCGSCKAMGNVYEELQEKFDQQPVLWLVLDHTRSHHRTQSAFLAQALGLGEVWAENGGKTGFILLVDADGNRVLGKLTREHGIKQMGTALMEALDRARG